MFISECQNIFLLEFLHKSLFISTSCESSHFRFSFIVPFFISEPREGDTRCQAARRRLWARRLGDSGALIRGCHADWGEPDSSAGPGVAGLSTGGAAPGLTGSARLSLPVAVRPEARSHGILRAEGLVGLRPDPERTPPARPSLLPERRTAGFAVEP